MQSATFFFHSLYLRFFVSPFPLPIDSIKNTKTTKNPGYMKENFVICIESLHVGDIGNQQNVSDANGGNVCILSFDIRSALYR